MHTADMGILPMCLGSALSECFDAMGGRATRPEATLCEMRLLLNTFSRELGHRDAPLAALTLPMFRAKSKPHKLKCKASTARRLLPCVLRLCEVLPLDSDHARLRRDCLRWARP